MAKIAIVTGSGQGIGEGIARQLVNDGFTVAVADMNEENAKEVAEEIGNDSKGYYVDVSKKDSVFGLVEQVVADFGKLDVLVNNAGIAKIGTASILKVSYLESKLQPTNSRNKEPVERSSVPLQLPATKDSSCLARTPPLNLRFVG